jgi:hypothetical protein
MAPITHTNSTSNTQSAQHTQAPTQMDKHTHTHAISRAHSRAGEPTWNSHCSSGGTSLPVPVALGGKGKSASEET